MDKSGTIRSELSIGMDVEINPKTDRSRKERIKGIISEFLTNTPTHTHGIMVKLDNGQIGRVKNIISNSISSDSNVSSTNNSKEPKNTIESTSTEDLLLNGENHFVEFKSSLLWSERLSDEQVKKSPSKYVQLYGTAASKAIIAASIAGFLNADGGNLFIGIKENKDTNKDELIGIESEFFKLKDKCVDGYRRKILDSIIKPFFPSFIFNHFNKYLRMEFPIIDDKLMCRISISKADKQVFIKIRNVESFYVRIDASTRTLSGEEVVDYCLERF